MESFSLHWAPVPGAPPGRRAFALWPAPVNPDECFLAAGFTDFADAGPEWDAAAEGVLTRLLEALQRFGPPRLLSEPRRQPQSWLAGLFRPARVFELREQVEQPLHWDDLPDCRVEFGDAGAGLRTGQGHHLYWITLPEHAADTFERIATEVAGSHPLVQTHLQWKHLQVGHGPT